MAVISAKAEGGDFNARDDFTFITNAVNMRDIFEAMDRLELSCDVK